MGIYKDTNYSLPDKMLLIGFPREIALLIACAVLVLIS